MLGVTGCAERRNDLLESGVSRPRHSSIGQQRCGACYEAEWRSSATTIVETDVNRGMAGHPSGQLVPFSEAARSIRTQARKIAKPLKKKEGRRGTTDLLRQNAPLLKGRARAYRGY